ncbi:MAG: HlyC/CorC family transporter [Clostridia bacterium]|nr:HlyC/CorC family transporter [Clostridia bacterium]
MDSWPTTALSLAVLIGLSAFFSGSEIAYASANRLRLKKAAEEGGLRARVTNYIAENYDRTLCTVLIGNNLVNMSVSSLATVVAIALLGEALGPAWATALSTVALLIFGEITPKTLAKQYCDGFAGVVALPLRLVMFVLSPLVSLVLFLVDRISRLWGGQDKPAGVTEDDLVTLIETVEDEGVIDEERSDLLQSAIEFREIEAQEITTHRVDMLAIGVDTPIAEVEQIAFASPYSRIPVYDDNVDNIVGVLQLNHLYKKLIDGRDFPLREILTPVCYVPQTQRLPLVLAEMKRSKLHMAVVVDEYGGTLGILTMEDVLEQLVGDIWDETDEIVDEIRQIDETHYEAVGSMSIYDFLDAMELDYKEFEEEFVTLGGWVIEVLEGFPQVGDSFPYRNLVITVAEMEELRVTRILVERLPVEEEEE